MNIKDYKKKMRGKGDINMSLYEINKNLMSQLPDYTHEQVTELEGKIDKLVNEKYINNNYFMLLCNDIHYYTVFHLNPEEAEFRTVGEGVTGLLYEAGYTISGDEECDDHYEIWVKKDKTAYAFMLFPYDEGVVNFG